MEYIILFESSHSAMKNYKLMQNSSLKAEIIPTPREISSECGFAILIIETTINEILDFCKESNLNKPEIYSYNGEVYEKY